MKDSSELYVKVHSLISSALWQIGDYKASVKLLRLVIERTKSCTGVKTSLAAYNLLTLGFRIAAGRLEAPAHILANYLVPGMQVLPRDSSEETGVLHLKFGTFCHDQLISMDQSGDYERISKLKMQKLDELHLIDSMMDETETEEDLRRLRNRTEKGKALVQNDDIELSEIMNARNTYIEHSIRSFLQAFAVTDCDDTLISRCSSLWFANGASSLANVTFHKYGKLVPSHKFLNLLNQFLARLSTSADRFQEVLGKLLLRLATDHPYHTLYHMYAVQYSKRTGDVPANERSKAITRIIQTLSSKSTHTNLVTGIRLVCSNYVKLASKVLNKRDFPTKEIPFSSVSNHRIFLSDIPKLRLPPMTLRFEARLSCEYSDIPVITGYEKTFNLAGGISAPKILRCRVSTGALIKELVSKTDHGHA